MPKLEKLAIEFPNFRRCKPKIIYTPGSVFELSKIF